MKNSIGSLAALTATLAAAPAVLQADPIENDIRDASFSDVSLNFENENSIYFDIDGNGTNEFRVYSNGLNLSIRIEGTTLVTAAALAPESTLYANAANSSNAYLTDIDPISFTTGYYGFQFDIVTGVDESPIITTHMAWVYFDFTGPELLVVNGAWEANSDFDYIEIPAAPSPVPEPSSAAALAGAAALTGAFALRRRRRS